MMLAAWSIVLLLFAAPGDYMTTQANMDNAKGKSELLLPVEPKSSSELLSAHHLFLVEILDLAEQPWGPGANGLESRQLRMHLRLLEVFKGTLQVATGAAFPLDVQQQRESEYVTSDYHGLWSHLSPTVGAKYLVFGDGSSNSPAALMQEDACQKLLGPEYVPDVHLAIEAEAEFRQASRPGQHSAPEGDPALALLHFGFEKRSQAKDLFERYLWARVSPEFQRKQPQTLSQILQLMAEPSESVEFRSGLISDVYDATVDLQPDPQLTQRVLRVFFSLLLQNDASPLHERLVDVEIFGLAFEDDRPAFHSASIFPDERERERLRGAVLQIDSDRARELAAWLHAKK